MCVRPIAEDVQKLGEELEDIKLNEAVESITKLANTINTSVEKANLPNLSATFTNLGESLTKQSKSLESAVENIKMDELTNNITVLTDNLANTSITLREAMPRLTAQTNQTLNTIEEALDQLKLTLSTVHETIQDVKIGMDFGEIGDETNNTLNSLSRAAASLEALIDEVREKPSRLFFDSDVE